MDFKEINILQQIGNNIKKIRKINHLSQENLANKTGISISTIQKYESGDIDMSILKLIDIAKVLNVNLDNLIDGFSTIEKMSKEDEIKKELKLYAEFLADKMLKVK